MANPFRPRLVKFETVKVVRRSQDAMKKGFEATAKEMTKALRKVLNVKGTPKLRSKPGQPPRRQTGFLHDNIEVQKKNLTLQVRVPQYGIWLETGTGRMAARPYILKTINNRRTFWTRRINANTRKHAK